MAARRAAAVRLTRLVPAGQHTREDHIMSAASGQSRQGLKELAEQPLLSSIWRRRTHRVSRGSSVQAGPMSHTSTHERAPLTELEEAIVMSLTGCTGLTMPDRPFADPRDGKPIMAKPNLYMAGRAAGSPDNAQGTHFFLINDTGTYYLRKLPPADGDASVF